MFRQPSTKTRPAIVTDSRNGNVATTSAAKGMPESPCAIRLPRRARLMDALSGEAYTSACLPPESSFPPSLAKELTMRRHLIYLFILLSSGTAAAAPPTPVKGVDQVRSIGEVTATNGVLASKAKAT